MEYGKVYNQKDTLYYDGFVKIYETTLAVSTTGSVSITGLNGNTDVEYKINVGEVASTSFDFFIRPNNDTGASNYGRQVLDGGNTVVGAFRDTSDAGFYVYGEGYGARATLYAPTGYVRTMILENDSDSSGTTVGYVYLNGMAWADTTNNITSLVFTPTSAGQSLLAGTYISLFAKRSRQ